MIYPFLAIVKKELGSVLRDRTIVISILIQFFIASFSSGLLLGMLSLYDADTISRIEADCLIGHQSDGTVVDPNSARCKDFTGRVDRVPLTANLGAGTLISVTTCRPCTRVVPGRETAMNS